MKKQLIECPKCGHGNELTGMFCRKCGTKLDHSKLKIDEVTKKARAGAKKERGRGPNKVVMAVEAVVGLALIGAAVALFWPVKPIGEVGQPAAAEELAEKLTRLQDASENNIEMEMILSEGEINAYLAKLVEETGSLGDDGPTLEDVNLLLEMRHVEVYVRTKVGPLPLAYVVRGEPAAGQGPFTFTVQEATIGKVPVPEGMRDKFVVSKVAGVFSGLADERAILDRAKSMTLAKAKVRITTRGE